MAKTIEMRFLNEWEGGGMIIQNKYKKPLNKYRHVESTKEGQYLEFMIEDKIAKCDVEDEKLLLEYSWRYIEYESDTAIISSVKKHDTIVTIRFNHLILNTKDSVKHINGNQLDCRKSNLQIVRKRARQLIDIIPEKTYLTELKIVKTGEWMGGIPEGGVMPLRGTYVVRLTKRKVNKRVHLLDYSSPEEAYAAAKQCQFQEATNHNVVRNKMRMIEDRTGEVYLEIQVDQGKTFICDMQDANIVKQQSWHVIKGHTTYYVASGKVHKNFHNLILPYKVVDHINGNGLDNRRCNLRDGTGNVNARNAAKRKDNKSGITGVCFNKGRWIVQWPEDGTRKSKEFSKANYGSLENAREAAITFRKEIDEKYDLHPRQRKQFVVSDRKKK